MSNHKLKILYINMDKDTDKRAALEPLLESLNFDYSRISAIDGNEIAHPEIYIDVNFKDPNKGRNQTLGELGCAMSHMKAWKVCVESDCPVLIFEDDVVITQPVKTVKKIIRQATELLKKTDLIYLGRQPLADEEPSDEDWVKPKYSWLAHAYMITPVTAEILLDDYFTKNIIPVDEWIPFLIGTDCDLYVKTKFSVHVKNRITALAYKNSNLIEQNRELGNATETMDEICVPGINPAKTQHAVLTVATDINDAGFKYLSNSIDRYGFGYFNNIADGAEWTGGDVKNSPGAGQKINLLKSYIADADIKDDDILIFLDGYDTAVFAGPFQLIQRWVDNFDTSKVLFAAEKICWPDSSIADQFSSTEYGYDFLNSGCFIGTVNTIMALLESDIADSEDDQLYYQQVMLSTDLIEIDSECKIFQCLASAVADIFYEEEGAYIINRSTGTLPIVMHGNGGETEKTIYYNLMSAVDVYHDPGCFRRWIGPKDNEN